MGNYNLKTILLLLNPVKPDEIAMSVVGPINVPIMTSNIAPTMKTSNMFWTLNIFK